MKGPNSRMEQVKELEMERLRTQCTPEYHIRLLPGLNQGMASDMLRGDRMQYYCKQSRGLSCK